MTKRPLILISNDDGIGSLGLRAAARAALPLGEVLVVAPATQQTAMGRSITGRRDAALVPVDFQVDGVALRAFSCEGSPASVVAHALRVLCVAAMPDLVISGINYGENMGSSITASGTIGAAVEAASWGIPALAVSQQMHPSGFLQHGDHDWDAAEHFLAHFASRLLAHTLPFDVDILKLDVPEGATRATPWRLGRLSRQRYIEMVLDQPTPDSRLCDSRLTIQVDAATLEPGSDIHSLLEQVVAVTPLSLDATSRADFSALHTLLGGAASE